MDSTGFPALFSAAFARWRAYLPSKQQRRAATHLADLLGFTDTKNFRNWMQGISAPASDDAWAAVRGILAQAPANAEHLPALDAAFAHAQGNGLAAPDPGMAAEVRGALPVLAATQAPAGAAWTTRDDAQLDIDTSPARSDIEAVQDPHVSARHESVKRKIRTLLDTLGHRLGNYRGWEAFRPAVEELHRTTDCTTAELPERIIALYDAMVSVASFIDQDNGIEANPASLFEPLPPDIRRAVRDLVATGAPFVRAFPTARISDDEAGAFLARPELFEPLRELLDISRRTALIVDEAAERIAAELVVAARVGFQAQKAGSRAVATIRNFIGFTAGIVATVYLGAIGSQVQAGNSIVAQRGGAVFLQGESAIRRLIEDLPPDFRAAVDIVIAASKARRDHANDEGAELPPPVDTGRSKVWRPPLTPLARWREPAPGLPEAAWPNMVTLPAGVFTMGAPETEKESGEEERPQRQVTVPRPFALGRTAVTFAMWDAARSAGADLPHPPDQGWGRDQRPVINVSWEDAQSYCAWLNTRLGLRAETYRLPSEAEWEYACRAGTVTPFSFGETMSPAQVNYDGNYTYGKGRKGLYRERTVPVAELPANVWGLHEMHGNVWEWCEDADGPHPNHATDSRPLIHADSSLRVLRGGSWSIDPRGCRSASRDRGHPNLRDLYVGVRLARTLF